jgi:hypothetical protein
VLPPSDVAKAAEIIREQFALRFWKLKVRKSFFRWFRQRYKVLIPHQDMVAWNGARYVRSGNYKSQYAHYWKAMRGQKENDKHKSLLAAWDCITRATNSTSLNWEDGSRPFFWRWSEEYCHHIQDGIPLWYQGDPPRRVGSQRKEKDPEVRKNMGIKLMAFFARRYFEYGLILSLTSFFSVPKGDTYIRMVYNAPSSGMNAHLWAP